MRRNIISALVTGLFVLGVTASGQAAVAGSSYYFDFEWGSSYTTTTQVFDELTMSINGIGLDVMAVQIVGDDDTISSYTQMTSPGGVHSSYTGIGAATGINDGKINGSSTAGLDEGLLFSFNVPVQLELLNMGSFTDSDSDDVNLFVNDGSGLYSVFFDQTGNDGSYDHFNITVMNGNTPLIGTQFLIWADGASDDFQVDGMRVSAVPLPGAAWLLFSGLVGLVGMRRKKG